MILDKENLFSDKQLVSATANADNIVDLGISNFSANNNASLFACTTPYVGTGTLVVELLTSSELNNGIMVNPVTVATYPITNAALIAGGKIVDTRIPMGVSQYAGLRYTVTGTLAGGIITSGIAFDA
ncbi:Bbp16 family capsid cement protein [Desulfovibrio litoralis]|uniref:Uncharacterized protein n=1 Tax=Desulfovibrio litoralis DSM 11393 TaxID=1121455 RepID=A0A1M7T842_9BACT|nr:hypothetical protein [Desulfovibrio litoralis]SHN66847.1 hypothetical protein SAMN02745728_01700 [Desulfovibrio litoralis DSM 11393]